MSTDIKIKFSKLTGEEISSIFFCCKECNVFDIPENAEIITVCFSAKQQRRCTDCYFPGEPMDVDIVDYELPKLQKVPDYPEFYIERARLQTFDAWPKTLKQTPQELSAAGFFFTQKDDRVICFCCGGGLHTWEENDDPWHQHALHYGECEYLQLMKGVEYIASVKEKINNNHSEEK